MKKSLLGIVAIIAAFVSFFGSAYAYETKNWEMWHQPPASDMAARIAWFDYYTFLFIIPISLLVLALLIVVVLRFNAKANPSPSKTTHNTMVEVIWTVVPIIILVLIAVPSFDLLNRQLAPTEEPELTVKVTGNQWYWSYEYQDDSELEYDSVLIGREKYSDPDAAKEERAEYGKTDESEYPYLLAVDYEMVVPVNKMVRVVVTAADVLHAFAVPALGFRIDAVPGRLNETWFKAEREGLYYGQCSELCGKDHAFMPIAIRVVSEDQYKAWTAAAQDDMDEANKALMASIESNVKVAQKQ